jgi:hypothetical protein
MSHPIEKQHFSYVTNINEKYKTQYIKEFRLDETTQKQPFNFVLALHHLQEKSRGTVIRCAPHSSLPFRDAPLLLPDLQRKHAYSPVDNIEYIL